MSQLRLVDSFLRQTWIPYLKADSLLGESDRERIEREVTGNLSAIKIDVDSLNDEFSEASMSNSQVSDHANNIVAFLRNRYKVVEASLKRLKKLRMQIQVQEMTQEYFHLIPKRSFSKPRRRSTSTVPLDDEGKGKSKMKDAGHKTSFDLGTSDEDVPRSMQIEGDGMKVRRRKEDGEDKSSAPDGIKESPDVKLPKKDLSDLFDQDAPKELNGISSQQRQELELENEGLKNHLNSLDDQLREVETQLHSIGDATSFMAATIEEQAEQLSHIFDLTTEARGSITRGTKNLNIAKATTSDLRLFTLVLLIFLSASLLILHHFY